MPDLTKVPIKVGKSHASDAGMKPLGINQTSKITEVKATDNIKQHNSLIKEIYKNLPDITDTQKAYLKSLIKKNDPKS